MSPAWVAAIAAVIAAIAAVAAVKPLHWLWRLLIGTHEFITDWPRMKAAIGDLQLEIADDWARMKAAIGDLQLEIADIKTETKPNGGSSMHDVMTRTERAVDEVRADQASMRARMEQLETQRTVREDEET